MKDFRKLDVWKKSRRLTLAAYRTTAGFSRREMYGLTNQIRRSCASIAANVAEGCGREGDAELGRFLQIAMGSASELEYHLLLAHDLGMLNESGYRQLSSGAVEVKRMLASLIRKLKADRREPKAES